MNRTTERTTETYNENVQQKATPSGGSSNRTDRPILVGAGNVPDAREHPAVPTPGQSARVTPPSTVDSEKRFHLDTELQRLLESAVAHHSSGRLDQAEELYLRAQQLRPDDPDVLHLRGVVAYQRGRLEEASELIGRAVSLLPTEPGYHSNLGNVRKAIGSWDDAIESYRTALRLDPGFVDARNNLGVALEAMGRNEEAAAEFREVIAREPGSAAAHNNLGSVERSVGRIEESFTAYTRAIELDPDYADAHHNLGNLWLQKDRPEEAVRAFVRALEVGAAHGGSVESAETRLRLALALHRLGQVDEAVDQCRRAVVLRPGHADTRNALGTLLQEQGFHDDAVAAYREAIRLDPTHGEAPYNLATALQAVGRVEEAVQGYRAALAATPRFTKVHRALGKLLYGLGDVPGALEVYREWAAIAPDDPEATHLVAACSGQDVPDRASSEFVRTHFNEFARHFDRQLTGLGYCGPELVHRALGPYISGVERSWDVLDAGCGTGMSGLPLRPLARRLVGVDLAEKMLELAAGRKVYDALEAVDLVTYLEWHPSEFDLVAAADTVVYFGRLDPFFAGVARALRKDGLFVFTAEDWAGGAEPGFTLDPGGRYAHTRDYLLRTLGDAGFRPLDVTRSFLRSEMETPVEAWIIVARLLTP